MHSYVKSLGAVRIVVTKSSPEDPWSELIAPAEQEVSFWPPLSVVSDIVDSTAKNIDDTGGDD